MDLFDKCKNYTLPDELIKKRIYPYFHALQTKQDTEVVMEGTNVIMLGSNNYLGLTSHPDVIEAGKNAILKYGSGCSGSFADSIFPAYRARTASSVRSQ